MLSKLLQNKFKILGAIGIVLCFALVRLFEYTLFYDPFLNYFKNDFNNSPYPIVETGKLFFGLFFRYFLNSALSLILIYILFQNRDMLKFSAILYVLFLIVLLGMFFVVLEFFPNAGWLLFYVRRFIIQPLLVLLFIPGFYYQLQNSKK
ncbi:exosortase F system-associated protein [Flavobacterium sp. 17A]|uniref:Exosortase F system-associated protein n=1 Tax=Flavobacterium potami TaxID=2872310 RepID=A0A9X1HD98_9FLAO|nr:exosortase F system-associated protein [Flavobacterium potami]MBZ4036252.1 exosortase F system-associated protein [Flavobacterium potami]